MIILQQVFVVEISHVTGRTRLEPMLWSGAARVGERINGGLRCRKYFGAEHLGWEHPMMGAQSMRLLIGLNWGQRV